MEAGGAHYLRMPTYSPELNPSELCFAKLKYLLKHRNPHQELIDSILDCLEAITYEDMVLFYMHCGYFG
jgi:transposase